MAKKTDSAQSPQATQAIAATSEDQALSTEVYDFGDDAGSGFEGQGSDDVKLPMLGVLQALSPKVGEDPDKYRPGMFYNSITGKTYDGKKGVEFVPCYTEHKFAKFIPRNQGGGFRGLLDPSDPVVLRAKKEQTFGEWMTPDGEELTETFYMYGVINDPEDGPQFAVIPFTGMKIKVYKAINSALRMIQVGKPGAKKPAPLFASVLRLTTRFDRDNPKGDFHNLVVERVAQPGPVEARGCLPRSSELYQAAKSCHEAVTGGLVKVDHAAGVDDAQALKDEEAPF